jgi:hypothetical protein
MSNEYKALKTNGWKCIKINRTTGIDNYGSNHISETELEVIKDEDWDYIIDNNGTLEDLFVKLDEIVKKINASEIALIEKFTKVKLPRCKKIVVSEE